MTGPSRNRPLFATRETAWLWVPFRWTTGVSIALFGAMLLAFAANHLMQWHAGGLRPILVFAFGAPGLFFALIGMMGATRRGPALTADSRGVVATCAGLDRTRISWDQICGVRVIGRKRMEKMLVILSHDPEACLAQADAAIAAHVRKLNRKHGLAGALYVSARTMRRAPELVAHDIEDLLAIQREEQSARAESEVPEESPM
jgi:hypothetical protein